MYVAETIKKTCQNCLQKFGTKNMYQLRCSPRCSYEYQLKQYKRKPLLKKKCGICLIKFSTNIKNKIFCSKTCQLTSSSTEYLLTQIHKLKKQDKICWLKLRVIILDRDGFKCIYCGKNPREDNVKLHIDHKIPRNKGGKDTLDNLITSCDKCNLGKSDRMLHFWEKSNQNS
jgi:5-methylcytosine-specific restriction endonuclease McrA